MISPDIALALLINRCATAMQTNVPPYVSFEEHTHISGNAGPIRINKDVNRAVSVRTADGWAVMQDLPQGARETGSAFPVPPIFDPFSNFGYSYYLNLKKVDLEFYLSDPYVFNVPKPDPNAQMTIPYFTFFAPRYAPDSTDQAMHLLIDPTPRIGDYHYVSEVKIDPATQLPSDLTLQMPDKGGLITIHLGYAMVQNHWIVTHGSLDSSIHGGIFKGHAETTLTNFTFPTVAPDPALSGTPRPTPTPAPSASP